MSLTKAALQAGMLGRFHRSVGQVSLCVVATRSPLAASTSGPRFSTAAPLKWVFSGPFLVLGGGVLVNGVWAWMSVSGYSQVYLIRWVILNSSSSQGGCSLQLLVLRGYSLQLLLSSGYSRSVSRRVRVIILWGFGVRGILICKCVSFCRKGFVLPRI